MENKITSEKLFCGIDVSSKTLDVCYQTIASEFAFLKIENSTKGFQKLQKTCGLNYHFVMEATGVYHLNFVFYLREKQSKFSIVNSLQIKRYIQMQLERNKSDRKDARYICQYGIDRKPKESELPDNEYFICKTLNNSIEAITNEITTFQNKLHSLSRMPVKSEMVGEVYRKIIEKLKKGLKKLSTELDTKLTNWQPDLVEKVSSVVSIGKRATAEVIVFTQGFKNMEKYQQLISYSGLSPKEYSSGSSIRGKTKICKNGGGRLRNILYMCALNIKENNNACKALYDRMVERGKNKKVALIAVCAKLLKQIHAVVKKQENFDINYLTKIA